MESYRTDSFRYRGHELVYDTYGEGDRLLVYLHGLLLDAELNRGIAGALAERGNRVVLLDLLGHGRSDKPAHASEYRIDSYASQVFALLDHLGATEAVLGGLSLGANVSLFAATQRPDRVRAVVLEMPVLEWAVPAAAMAFVPIVLAAHYGRPVLRVVTDLVRRVPRTPFGPLNSILNAASSTPEVLAAIMHGVLVGPVAPTQEERSRIAVPALILAHRNDLIHPFDDARALAGQLPRAELVPARSPFELRLRPQRLTDRLAEFLRVVWEPPRERLDTAGPADKSRDTREVCMTTPMDDRSGWRTAAAGRHASEDTATWDVRDDAEIELLGDRDTLDEVDLLDESWAPGQPPPGMPADEVLHVHAQWDVETGADDLELDADVRDDLAAAPDELIEDEEGEST